MHEDINKLLTQLHFKGMAEGLEQILADADAEALPAREVLYTVVPREDRYKAKNFIDTFVYRSGDQVGAWSYTYMGWFGLSLAAIAFVAVPIAGMWMLIALSLGFKQEKLASDREQEEAA